VPTPSGFLNLDNIRSAKTAIESDGFLLLKNAYSKEWCSQIIELMDAHSPDERTYVNYGGSELRIFDAERRHPAFKAFFDECNVFTAALTGRYLEASTLLAIRNRAVDADEPHNYLGRWHIDSFQKQLKVFVFLTDTSEESGPFEFIPGTQTTAFKMRMLLRGAYFSPFDLMPARRADGLRAYQRIDDGVIQRISRGPRAPMPVVCEAGTALVIDTSAIHRARPCQRGKRYALTAYCR
jgi:ectoine hydroxylase-related dioxygenase (phytanoyl-CoA dioxygenase family)